jgi:LPS-assembly protein
MSLAWLRQGFRQAIRIMGWLMLAVLGSTVSAGESLPPLRVDPALLGGAPLKPAVSVQSAQSISAKPATSVQPQLAATVTAAAQPQPTAQDAPAAAIPHPATTPFSQTDKKSAPTSLTANKVDGINDVEVVAEGDARLERAGDTLTADRIVYRQLEDEVEAKGKVRLISPDTEISGPRMRMRLEEGTGEFESPAYMIKRQPSPVPEPALTLLGLPTTTEGGAVLATTGRMLVRPAVTGSGVADRLEFRGEDQYHLENATFSTCAPGKRDWEMVVDVLDLDYTGEVGAGRNAVVKFMDVPFFYMPWMNFSLNNQKKSGFLPPTIGSTSKSGLELTAPWFWNIAPDMDATITPRLMTRRGVQLNTELRYLLDTPQNRTQPGMPDKGQVRVEYLPGDQLANRDRYGYSISHNQVLGHGFAAALNLNGVSDDNYFSDLSTRVSQVSQGNLLRQGMLTYGGPWYSAAFNVQSYQTLQNLAKPYQRLPQLTGTAFRYDLPLGMAFNLNAEYVNFDHPTELIGKRTTLYPQLSLPLATAAFSLTPKIGVHATQYELEGLNRPAAVAWSSVPTSQNRAIPIFNVDGSFVMERDTNWFGQSLVQTLEPRAYYLYVPNRDQSKIPVFDTGIAGFNYAQMFSENRYAGGDRIGDANELTLAVTSRLLDPASGADLLRATLGTRYYFTDQQVTLPGETARTERSADILGTFAGQVLPHIYADIGWQYNPRDARTDRLTLSGRYRPEAGKVINAGYRYARDLLGQIDVSAQWPLFGGWHGVGRYNYSTKENRVIEIIGGLEYDAGCWAGRFVVQRLATIADQPTTAIFFQLELNDFARIGSSPLQLLRRNIPGYGVINQPTADPIFAEN